MHYIIIITYLVTYLHTDIHSC